MQGLARELLRWTLWEVGADEGAGISTRSKTAVRKRTAVLQTAGNGFNRRGSQTRRWTIVAAALGVFETRAVSIFQEQAGKGNPDECNLIRSSTAGRRRGKRERSGNGFEKVGPLRRNARFFVSRRLSRMLDVALLERRAPDEVLGDAR